MKPYGQFCPVGKAMELLDERWTLLVVRELLAASRHVAAIRRGVSTDLRTLVAVWRGDYSWSDALRSGQLRVDGPSALRRVLPSWFETPLFATVAR